MKRRIATREPAPPGGRRRGRPLSPAIDERILDAALDMLAENGYGGLRLDALAARAGVAKTTILRRWPSKATVAAAAVERLALQTIDVPESGTLRGDLHALLTSAVTVFTHGRGSFVPRLIRESGHHPEIASLLETVIHTRRLAYRRVLGRAIARHELDPDVDQELLIDLLVGPSGRGCSSPTTPSPRPSSTKSWTPSAGPSRPTRPCKRVSRSSNRCACDEAGRWSG